MAVLKLVMVALGAAFGAFFGLGARRPNNNAGKLPVALGGRQGADGTKGTTGTEGTAGATLALGAPGSCGLRVFQQAQLPGFLAEAGPKTRHNKPALASPTMTRARVSGQLSFMFGAKLR